MEKCEAFFSIRNETSFWTSCQMWTKAGARSSPAWSSGPSSLQCPPCQALPHILRLHVIYLRCYQSPQSISWDLFQRSPKSRQWITKDYIRTITLNPKIPGWILFATSLARIFVEEEHTSTRFLWDYCCSGSGEEFLSSMPFHRAKDRAVSSGTASEGLCWFG